MQKTKGVTLIELLIVIAIITALSVLFINNSVINLKRARDARRESDIKQYQNSLEIYATKNSSLYPSRNTGSDNAATTLCADLQLTGCPTDPQNGNDATFVYSYESDGTGGGATSATKYVLWAKLEVSTNYWVVCSNGLSGTKPQAGFSVVGGTCPLP